MGVFFYLTDRFIIYKLMTASQISNIKSCIGQFFMVTFEGSHGTTKARAEEIGKKGFDVSGGRFVSGAYFWIKSHLFVELAIGWYKRELSKYQSAGEPSPKCAVIIADLNCEDNEFIDLDRQDFKDRLAKLSEIRATNQNSERAIYALYAYVIKELESIGKISFKILLLKVPPPKEVFCPRYKLKILGFPTSVIARSNENILIKDINHFERV